MSKTCSSPATVAFVPAKSLGMSSIPAIVIKGLSDARKRALMLADNRIAQDAGWDVERLAEELGELPELLAEDGLDVSVTGFEPAEIDRLTADFEDPASDPADDIDVDGLDGPTTTRAGDLWQLGKHRLLWDAGVRTTSFACSGMIGRIWRF